MTEDLIGWRAKDAQWRPVAEVFRIGCSDAGVARPRGNEDDEQSLFRMVPITAYSLVSWR